MAELQSTNRAWGTLAEIPAQVRKELVSFVLLQRGDEIIRVWCRSHVERDGGVYMIDAVVDMGIPRGETANPERYVLHHELVFGGAWCWSIQQADLA